MRRQTDCFSRILQRRLRTTGHAPQGNEMPPAKALGTHPSRALALLSQGVQVAPTSVTKRKSLSCGGVHDRPQFAVCLRAVGWTNLGGEFGPPTRVGVDDRGHERHLPTCTGHIDLVHQTTDSLLATVVISAARGRVSLTESGDAGTCFSRQHRTQLASTLTRSGWTNRL